MFYFTDDCVTGIEILDTEHRYLFDLMRKIIDASNNVYLEDRYNVINEIIVELEDYADRHFQDEENYMIEIRDPELIKQRAQHNYFRNMVDELSVHNFADDEEQQAILEKSVDFLARWLYGHIIASDLLIGKLPPLEEWMVKENPCEFTIEYMTGNEMIDEEHRVLFRIIDKAYHMTKERITEEDIPEIQKIVDELLQYTKDHFRDEEEYMESIHYDKIDAQKRAHQAFVTRIEEMSLEKVHGNLQEETQSLVEFLLGWLVNHILNMDKKIPIIAQKNA